MNTNATTDRARVLSALTAIRSRGIDARHAATTDVHCHGVRLHDDPRWVYNPDGSLICGFSSVGWSGSSDHVASVVLAAFTSAGFHCHLGIPCVALGDDADDAAMRLVFGVDPGPVAAAGAAWDDDARALARWAA